MTKHRGPDAASVVQDVPARFQFHCPACDHVGDVTWRHDSFSGRLRPMIGSFSARCPKGGECLRAIADAVGCRPHKLLSDPVTYLDPVRLSGSGTRRDGSAGALPTEAHIDGWHSRLMATDDALDWLMRLRGLLEETIVRYRLGWDGDTETITLPVYDAEGRIVNLRCRKLGKGEPFKGLYKRGAQLYPDVPASGALLLVAGELDALIGRQLGLPAVTTTCGAKLPDPLVSLFLHHKVFVMFDVGEESAATRVSAKLHAAGITATVVRLRRLGLPHGADLNDLVLQGGTAAQIKALIRRTVA